MKNNKNGFTLIEMSIALVIIGFIVAGVMVGKSLIRGAQIRAVTSEFATYKQAMVNFRDKYQALPGDFSTASSIWSGVTNGNGDGHITIAYTSTRLDEQFLAWQQLAKAEFIKGSFNGVAGAAGDYDRVIGTNIPASELDGAGWGIANITTSDILAGAVDIPYTAPDIVPNHLLWLGGSSVSGTTNSQKPVLSPSEAYTIDTKMDDGLPGSGVVVAQVNGTTGTCSTSATAYNMSENSLYCALVFKTGF